jgi:hypothetical protein
MLLELGSNYFSIDTNSYVEPYKLVWKKTGFQNIRTFIGCAKLVNIEN